MTRLTICPIRLWVKRIHDNAVAKGFWDSDPSSLAGRLMLVVSELAEAMEADRNGEEPYWENEDGKPDGVAVEIIDAIIRELDILGDMGVDVEDIMKKKMAYNEKKRGHLHGRKY